MPSTRTAVPPRGIALVEWLLLIVLILVVLLGVLAFCGKSFSRQLSRIQAGVSGSDPSGGSFVGRGRDREGYFRLR